MNARSSRWLISGTLIAGMVPGPLLADTLPVDKAVSEVAIATPFTSGAIDNAALAAHRGGAEVKVFNDNVLDGVVSGNQAYNLSTGSNLVSEGSFSGASGLATVIQNSGNNVLIQNSTIVNVQVK